MTSEITRAVHIEGSATGAAFELRTRDPAGVRFESGLDRYYREQARKATLPARLPGMCERCGAPRAACVRGRYCATCRREVNTWTAGKRHTTYLLYRSGTTTAKGGRA